MEFEDVVKNIEEFFDCGKQYEDFISSQLLQKTRSIYGIIRDQISVLEKDEVVDEIILKETSVLIKEIFRQLLNSFLINPISPQIALFIRSYCQLVFNWNVNTIADKELTESVLILQRLVDGHVTIMESITMLKELTEYLTRVKSWLPPTVDISKHYFDILQRSISAQDLDVPNKI